MKKKDTYHNYEEMQAGESSRFFNIYHINRHSRTAIVAIHGGAIEPGTSEITKEIAGNDLSFYLFEGLMRRKNGKLHITSTNFDEPQCLDLITGIETVVAIHGEESNELVVFLGGLDEHLKNRIQAELESAGYSTETHSNRNLQGLDRRNIVNRGTSGAGVQLEISKGLRKSFFESLNRIGRTRPTSELCRFAQAIRKAILVI